MAGLNELRSRLLRDRKITSVEVDVIKNFIAEDGRLDYADIKFLVGLMKDADYVCPEFDDLLFPCMREVILADGEVTMDEQYLLLQMLYSDGNVRDCERGFITELYRDVENVTPELQHLCETAMNTSGKQWDLGGKLRSENN
jgi:hypothetical protein